ncbi:MAG: cupin domain-containing protein [Caldilineaceae bacterium]|nr:cupin domain-containing protein [Caldilineaceae bacterium]
MAFQVYDYRTTNRNVLVTPEIRARLYRMEPGQIDGRHSHDLGHEVFLILEGKAEFTIAGHTEVLGPGQMCIAHVDEIHQVRNLLPDQPTIMYLSVTPHIQPTHTMRPQGDAREAPRFQPNRAYHDLSANGLGVAELLESHLEAAEKLAVTARSCAVIQSEMAEKWEDARAKGDRAAVVEARNGMSDAIYSLHKCLYALDAAWNALAPLGDD